MKKTIVAALIGLAAVTSMPSQADLISTDWKVAGDGLATLDRSTGKEWLDLSLTLNMSFNEVVAELNTTYAGWRIPTNEDISIMMSNNFGDLAYNSAGIAEIDNLDASYADSITFRNLFDGYTFEGNLTSAIGFYENEAGDLTIAGVAGSDRVIGADYNEANNQFYTNKHVLYGTFLVSDGGTTLTSIADPTINTSVPVPISVGLLGFGLFGMLARKKSKVA